MFIINIDKKKLNYILLIIVGVVIATKQKL